MWPFHELCITKSPFTKIRTSVTKWSFEWKIIFLVWPLKYFSSALLLTPPPAPQQKLPADLHLASLPSVPHPPAMLVFSRPKPHRISFLLLWLPIALRKPVPPAGLECPVTEAPWLTGPRPLTLDAPDSGHTGSCQLLLSLKGYLPSSVGACCPSSWHLPLSLSFSLSAPSESLSSFLR